MDVLERVGAYAGLAAFLGLAILALLYFSQARDVRRLRDWAGRAPERSGESAARAVETAPIPAAQHGLPPLSLAESEKRKRKPLGERLRNVNLPPLRYVAVGAVALLLIGGGIFAATQFLGDSGSDGGTPSARSDRARQSSGNGGGGGGQGQQTVNVDPAQVTVAVLNGTTVQGLGARVGEEVRAGGFTPGTIGNAARIDQGRTQVLYREGQGKAARAVAERLGIKSTALVDQVNREIAGSFDVVVLVGSDRSQ